MASIRHLAMLQCIRYLGPGILTMLSQIVTRILYHLHDCLRARRCLIFWHGDHWRIGPPIEFAGSPYTTTRSPGDLVGAYWHCLLLLLADCLRARRCLIFWHGDHWRISPHQLVLAGCHCHCHYHLPSAICHLPSAICHLPSWLRQYQVRILSLAYFVQPC